MVLRAIEQKIEALFEGVFGRAFRTNVQPVELARKLSKEMDDHRTVSVSRVYVPNEYTVYLSTPDHEQFAGYEQSLISELEEYLQEHARRESYALLTPPRVLLEVDDDLELGEFGIATRMVQPRARRQVDEPEGQVEPGATMIYKPRSAPAAAEEEGPPPEVDREVASLAWDGKTLQITKRRVLLGRSRECDIQVEDPNVSRRHAELRQEGSSYWIVDLDSTNGVEVNGKRVKRAKLESGDQFTVGSTEVTFTTERE
jgi:hypothetical protein